MLKNMWLLLLKMKTCIHHEGLIMLIKTKSIEQVGLLFFFYLEIVYQLKNVGVHLSFK